MSIGERVVFIDRDGVINQYPGDGHYVSSVKEFKFIPGSLEGIRKLYEKGFKVVVISNQSGVAKGLYDCQELEKINKKIRRELKRNRVELSGIYYCPHNPEDNCSCRKPKTGLLTQAISELKIKPMISLFVGDSFKDMNTAIAFGAKPVLVLSGREKISNRSKWEFEPDYIFDNLLLAAHYICAHYG
jgi:D-glycero-D-manno-heptose 1,7-bisphosphate phosphatase